MFLEWQQRGIRGLQLLDTHLLDMPGVGTEFFELVISHRNPFVGGIMIL